MPAYKLQHVKQVTTQRGAKVYWYFDTGQKGANGKPLMKRLPDPKDPKFGAVYAALLAGRTRRANVKQVFSLQTLCDLYQKSPVWADLKPNTQRLYRIYLRVVVDELMPMAAAELERHHMQILVDENAHRPGAANMMLAATNAMYVWGRSRGHVTNDPCREVKPLPIGEHMPWPEHVLDAALAAEDMDLRLAVALLLYTGQRIGDCLRMTLPPLGATEISVRQEKTDKELTIPLHRELAALIAWRRAQPRSSLTILTGPTGKRPAKAATVRVQMQEFAKKHGAKVVPHGLRKNAVIKLLEAECTVAQTAAITGQSFEMVEYYAKQLEQKKFARAAVLRWEGKA